MTHRPHAPITFKAMTFKDVCKLNLQSLSELDAVLKTLTDQQYQKSTSKASSSVGMHVRHIVDFYHCFFKGVDFGLIDYDHRQRNSAIEQSIELARDYIQNITLLLNAEDLHNKPDSVSISACLNKDQQVEASSSLTRELLFLQSHVTHHLAVVALLLEQQGIKLPKNFGVAASTRVHREVTEQT